MLLPVQGRYRRPEREEETVDDRGRFSNRKANCGHRIPAPFPLPMPGSPRVHTPGNLTCRHAAVPALGAGRLSPHDKGNLAQAALNAMPCIQLL